MRQATFSSCSLSRRVALAAIAMAGMSLNALAQAQVAYPARPIRLVVGYAPGGSVDMAARIFADMLAKSLNATVVVDNVSGAAGVVGAQRVVNAAPDGYTLMVSPASFLTTNKSIFKALPYDPEADFAPISKLVNQPMVLVVKDKQKFPNLAAVLAALKTAPGKVTYASSGDGSPQHLAALMFETRTQTKMLHVPYKGGAPAINDTLAGNVDLMFAVLPEALPHIQAGKLHALGLMSPQRSAILPNTPTMAESGASDLNLSAWVGLLAPARTPPAVLEKLNRTVQTVLADNEIKAKLGENGMEVAPGTPDELRQIIAQEIKLHAQLVKAAGLTPQ